MRTIILVFFLLLSSISYSQRNYINSDIDDFISTNEKYFCVPNTTVNQGMNNAEKDFYSTMRYAKVMGEVSSDGKTQIIGNVEISRVNFTKDHLVNYYLENLKMIILKPLVPTTAKRPCVLISIGGANANLSEFPFLATATHYLMKGYVVAYFENPNIKQKLELEYLEDQMGKQTVNNHPEVIFPAAVYLGAQIATAAAKYMSFHADKYNVNPNEFYGLGQSYGSLMIMHLGLGNSSNYNILNAPINKLDGLNFWVNDNMRQKTYTMKAISLWASAYPVDGPNTNNPFGELIGTDDKTRVIHFHGLLDDQVRYHSGWLLNLVNQSMYCHGVKDVIPRFKNANIDYLSFVVCGGGHPVLDTSAAKPFILGSGELSDVISEINFDNISSSYDTFKSYMDASYHLFNQGTNIADMTARYFQDKVDLTAIPTINYITPISATNGNFKQSNCMDQGFCMAFDQNVGATCDDNSICTSNDKIQPDCTCRGTFMDDDNDGTCNAQDVCKGTPEPGSSCDDNTLNTSNDKIQPDCTCRGTFVDGDGDGFASDVDCNDANTAIYPGAQEICDNKDNNCNNMIDEGLPKFTYYQDLDNDTFGAVSAPLITCISSAPAGFVSNSTDCNDTNPNINPSATDIANNGIDENCNGTDFLSSVYDIYASKIKVFPNPTTSFIYISTTEAILDEVSIFTSTGVKVKDISVSKEIDLSELNEGIYFLQFNVRGLDLSVYKKLVIQK